MEREVSENDFVKKKCYIYGGITFEVMKRTIIESALLVAMLSGCHGIDNPEGNLKDIKLEDWPLTEVTKAWRTNSISSSLPKRGRT